MLHIPFLTISSECDILLTCYYGDTKFMLSEMVDVGFWTVQTLEVKQDKLCQTYLNTLKEKVLRKV